MKTMAWLFIIVGVMVGWAYPFYFWFTHDTLSSMQVLKALWPQYLIGNLMYLAGYIHLERR